MVYNENGDFTLLSKLTCMEVDDNQADYCDNNGFTYKCCHVNIKAYRELRVMMGLVQPMLTNYGTCKLEDYNIMHTMPNILI